MTGETKILEIKTSPMTLCPPQIPHTLHGTDPGLPHSQRGDQTAQLRLGLPYA